MYRNNNNNKPIFLKLYCCPRVTAHDVIVLFVEIRKYTLCSGTSRYTYLFGNSQENRLNNFIISTRTFFKRQSAIKDGTKTTGKPEA